jgi:hypothetical protein
MFSVQQVHRSKWLIAARLLTLCSSLSITMKRSNSDADSGLLVNWGLPHLFAAAHLYGKKHLLCRVQGRSCSDAANTPEDVQQVLMLAVLYYC